MPDTEPATRTFLLRAAYAVPAIMWAGISLAQIMAIDGYDRYRFGMSLAEAQAVNPTAKKIPCGFKDVVFCLEYDTEISAFPARVDVQFEGVEPRASQVVITIDSLHEPIKHSCVDVAKELLKLLIAKYDSHPFVEKKTFTWSSPLGGSVTLLSLCITDSQGVNVVSYRKTGAL
jgi:hypothetical protein